MTLQNQALKGRQSSFALSGLGIWIHSFTGVFTPACAISSFQDFIAELAELETLQFFLGTTNWTPYFQNEAQCAAKAVVPLGAWRYFG